MRAIALEINGKHQQEKAIKQLITIEYQRTLHTTIKHNLNLITKSSPSKIQIPVTNEGQNNVLKDKSVKWKASIDSNEK